MPRAARPLPLLLLELLVPLLAGLEELELLVVVELGMAEPLGHQGAMLGAPRSA